MAQLLATTRATLKQEQLAFKQALALFREAAVRVPAYKDFLRKAKIKPDSITTPAEFAQVPPTDKPAYINAYPLKALSWDGSLEETRFISSSSGSTGVPLYWPRGERQNAATGELFRRVFENLFDSRHGTTLFVDMFALGPWIAGLEFYNAAKYVAEKGSHIAIVTPSFEKAAALDAIRRLSPSFDRLVLAGYPPFIKDVIESGAAEGIRWKQHDVRLFTAGESFSELWRDRLLAYLGTKRPERIINLYGMAEIGMVAHETPHSIALRRAGERLPSLREKLRYDGMTAALYQYDPLARYFEVGTDRTLVLTARAGLPLIRYNTRDQGGLITPAEAASYTTKTLGNLWQQLPSVYLYGRRDLSLSFYALNIYAENIKHCLEQYDGAHKLSGLFSMRVGYTLELDQRFEIAVELGRGRRPTKTEATALISHIAKTLAGVNSEYAKTLNSLGARAHPSITLVPYGQLDTLPGRKHRWVKRA